LNIRHGAAYGVNVYYPIMEKHQDLPRDLGVGFHRFEELKLCLAKQI